MFLKICMRYKWLEWLRLKLGENQRFRSFFCLASLGRSRPNLPTIPQLSFFHAHYPLSKPLPLSYRTFRYGHTLVFLYDRFPSKNPLISFQEHPLDNSKKLVVKYTVDKLSSSPLLSSKRVKQLSLSLSLSLSLT